MDPTEPDTDGDGIEDQNQNGRVDPGETDPRQPDHTELDRGPVVIDAGADVSSVDGSIQAASTLGTGCQQAPSGSLALIGLLLIGLRRRR